MKGCEHDKVYSGQTNLSQQFAYICRLCGECGWSDVYELSRVNFDEYCRQRVIHGWNSDRPSDTSARRAARLSLVPLRPERLRLPSPPRVPTNITRPANHDGHLVVGVVFFMGLAAICALSSVPWGELGPVLPLWVSLLGTGVAIGTATLLYVIWKRGSNG